MSKLLVKSNVKPISLIIAAACINQANEMGLKVDVVITSGNDSRHMSGSRHYTDEALDIRTKTMSKLEKRVFTAGVQKRLGKNYQCILEHEGGLQEHLHCEFDPK